MFQKRPTWTRSRAGRNRVHWVAYDDRAGAEDRRIVDQGYAASLAEADAAARSALAAAGLHQARRSSPGSGLSARPPREKAQARPGPERPAPRSYLYTRRHSDADDGPLVAAHLVVKKTAKKVHVSRRSVGPDQVGTEDEAWEANERTIALDRAGLEQAGSVFSKNLRDSDFFTTREAAEGDSGGQSVAAFKALALRAPCTIGEIKAAYRSRALAVHPDRGGSPEDFRAVEAAYRRLLREAQAAED